MSDPESQFDWDGLPRDLKSRVMAALWTRVPPNYPNPGVASLKYASKFARVNEAAQKIQKNWRGAKERRLIHKDMYYPDQDVDLFGRDTYEDYVRAYNSIRTDRSFPRQCGPFYGLFGEYPVYTPKARNFRTARGYPYSTYRLVDYVKPRCGHP